VVKLACCRIVAARTPGVKIASSQYQGAAFILTAGFLLWRKSSGSLESEGK
jgi:hypothetical protein